MKHINHTISNKFSIFIPTHVMQQDEAGDLALGEWIPINTERANFFNRENWVKQVNTLVKVSNNFVAVIFNDTYIKNCNETIHEVALYRGLLE